MILDEPYNSWLVKNVGENIDENTRFVVKVTAVTANGPVPLSVDFDLTWFILLHAKDDPKVKLDIALKLLAKKGYLDQFNATFKILGSKRLMAEFLLCNPVILDGLKQYINFTQLNVPLDFVSHALFIQRSMDPDTTDIEVDRLRIINLVLDAGFKLTRDVPPKSLGVAIHKILMMEVDDQKFSVVRRLLGVGFQLFSENMTNNTEAAVTLISNRQNQDCLEIIKNNAASFKALTFQVAGAAGSNIADYYYWVKEDMPAVEFIRGVLKIDMSP